MTKGDFKLSEKISYVRDSTLHVSKFTNMWQFQKSTIMLLARNSDLSEISLRINGSKNLHTCKSFSLCTRHLNIISK